jgi:hypothetical protein
MFAFQRFAAAEAGRMPSSFNFFKERTLRPPFPTEPNYSPISVFVKEKPHTVARKYLDEVIAPKVGLAFGSVFSEQKNGQMFTEKHL